MLSHLFIEGDKMIDEYKHTAIQTKAHHNIANLLELPAKVQGRIQFSGMRFHIYKRVGVCFAGFI